MGTGIARRARSVSDTNPAHRSLTPAPPASGNRRCLDSRVEGRNEGLGCNATLDFVTFLRSPLAASFSVSRWGGIKGTFYFIVLM
jgi:hypothetical protein